MNAQVKGERVDKGYKKRVQCNDPWMVDLITVIHEQVRDEGVDKECNNGAQTMIVSTFARMKEYLMDE